MGPLSIVVRKIKGASPIFCLASVLNHLPHRMTRRLTKPEFVAKARGVHGERFDYSKVEYVNSTTKVVIFCPEHGDFAQAPANHLSGFGCLKCGYGNAGQYHKKNTDSFIAEARKIHGNAYSYLKTVYRGAREKLVVTCPLHGDFEQVAYVHLKANPSEACLQCSYESRGERHQLSLDDFLAKATALHKKQYDYSLVGAEFYGAAKAVSIVCPVHGQFKQTPISHLRGSGCRKCATERLAAQLRKSTEEFISNAKRIHGELYDYSKVDYKGAFDNVTIICKKDGLFDQSPTSHLSGIGCPLCSRRAQGAPRNLVRAVRGEFDDNKPSFVYAVTFKFPGMEQQLFKLGTGSGSRLGSTLSSIRRVGGVILDTCKVDLSSTGEAIVFEQLAHQQIRQAQFPVPQELKFAGHSEVFTRMPDFCAIEKHDILNRYRRGERWTMKRAAKGLWI